ncbi:hypothetical protein ACFQ9X_30665 [Catenulispora yoronensis]
MAGGLNQADAARMARSGIAPLTVEQGMDAFDLALGWPEATLAAARWNESGLRARAENGSLPSVLRGLVRPSRRPRAVRRRPAAARRWPRGSAGCRRRTAGGSWSTWCAAMSRRCWRIPTSTRWTSPRRSASSASTR